MSRFGRCHRGRVGSAGQQPRLPCPAPAGVEYVQHPDNKWVIVRSNLHGPTHVYVVEVAKSKRVP